MNFKTSLIVVVLFMLSCGKSNKAIVTNIFGQDDRVLVKEATKPFTSIGKLNNGCTGTLIGKKLMLTAGHCVIGDNSTTPKAEFTEFVANMVDGQGPSKSTPVRAWVGGKTPEQDRNMDWAIVELADSIGDRQGTLAIDNRDLQASLPFQVSLAGYSADLGEGKTPSVHWNCSIKSIVEGGKIHHDCDATAGISGAPLMIKEQDTWKIVGISVSEFRQNLPPPVKREEWTEDYTNVGTTAAKFSEVASQLLASVDVGGAVPTLKAEIVQINFQAQTPVTPTPTPNPVPQPNPQPAPSQQPTYGYIPFSVNQIRDTVTLYQRVTSIHQTHWMLIEDAKKFENLSGASRFGYFIQASMRFTRGLSAQIGGFNQLQTNGPNSITKESLYQLYAELRSAQNQIFDVNRNYLPPPIAFGTTQAQQVLARNMAQLEGLLFY